MKTKTATTTTCPKCGSYLLPIGDYSSACCAKSIDGGCDSGRSVKSPGTRVLFKAMLSQKIPHATYHKKLRCWMLTNGGGVVKKGDACLSSLDFGSPLEGVAYFGKAVRRYEKSPTKESA